MKTDNNQDGDGVSNGQIEEEKLIRHQPRRAGDSSSSELKNSSVDSNDALAAAELENKAILPVIEEEKEPESDNVQITVKITREKKVSSLIGS